MSLDLLVTLYSADASYRLSPRSVAQLRYAISGFAAFCGSDQIDALTDENLSSYVDWLTANRSQAYARSRRNTLLVLWRYAWREHLIDDPPRRVRNVRPSRISPRAYTREQVVDLVAAASSLAGEFLRQFQPTGLERSQQMTSLIRAAYETGFRLGDLLRLTSEHIRPGGIVEIVQAKTGIEARKRLSIDTLLMLRDGPLWPLKPRCYQREFAGLRDALRLPEGSSLKWLRRAHGTHVAASGGSASAALGHAIPGTQRHYVDSRQIDSVIQPDDLGA